MAYETDMNHIVAKSCVLVAMGFFTIAMISNANAGQEENQWLSSYHAGFLSPHGGNIFDRTREKKVAENIYQYYTFGFPSIVSAGFSYYGNYANDGVVVTAGVGLGVVLYSSLSYKWKIKKDKFLIIGAGYGVFFEGIGAYPVISYETQFE